MPEWLTPLVTVLAALLGSGGLLVAVFERRAGNAERRRAAELGQPAVDMQAVSGASLALVEQLQEELTTARAAATAMARVEAQCAVLEQRLTTMIGWIHEPAMTIETLRRWVPAPPGINGRT